jgi:hypothetical protein
MAILSESQQAPKNQYLLCDLMNSNCIAFFITGNEVACEKKWIEIENGELVGLR